jgi:hypothetical protein
MAVKTPNSIIENKNFLSPLGFKLVFTRLPNVVLFSQTATLPSISVKAITVNNPILPLNVSTTTMDQGIFDVTFKVDEDLVNYREIYDWMVDLTFGRETSLYLHMGERKKADDAGVRSDASMIILNSAKNANIKIDFNDVFPISLTPQRFDAKQTDVDYVECTAQFSYRNFNISLVI